MSSEPYAEVVNGNYCDVCGKDGPDLDQFPVEVCRLCYMSVEHQVDVLKDERDHYMHERDEATATERRRIQEAVVPLLASLVRMPTCLTAGGRHIEGAIDREPVMVTVQRIRDAIDGVAPSTLGRLMVDR